MSLKSAAGPSSPFRLCVEGGVSNYPAFVDKCLEAAPELEPAEYARYMCALMRENRRPMPQPMSEAKFAESAAARAAIWAVPQRDDPLQPGYTNVSVTLVNMAIT